MILVTPRHLLAKGWKRRVWLCRNCFPLLLSICSPLERSRKCSVHQSLHSAEGYNQQTTENRLCDIKYTTGKGGNSDPWGNTGDLMLSEMIQSQADKDCLIPLWEVPGVVKFIESRRVASEGWGGGKGGLSERMEFQLCQMKSVLETGGGAGCKLV